MKSLATYISILRVVKTRPTKEFFFLVLMIVALFMQAYMHNYNIVYIIMFFLVSVAGTSTIFGILNLYKLELRLLSHERFFATTASKYKVTLLNKGSFSSYAIELNADNSSQNVASLAADANVTVSFETSFKKRGKARFPDITLSSLFPLPHERKYKKIDLNHSLYVYPKPVGISLFSIYNINNSLNGEMHEFESIREFEQGESISYIHWPSLAKSETLKSKTFLFEDATKSLHFSYEKLRGDPESRLSQLTLWVLECEKNYFAFTLEIGTKTLNSKEHSIDEVLQTIATY